MSDTALKTRNCRWIAVPGAADARGRINFIEVGKGLPFKPQRLLWLRHTRGQQWGGHGHRQSRLVLAELVLVALQGACTVHLDDGKATDQVMLGDPARALYVGPWVWHELTDFVADSTVMVMASTFDDGHDDLRDYETFKHEALARP